LSRFGAPAKDDWLSLGEASRLLGVAPATLRRWSDSGQVQAFTTPGGHRRYRRVALERLLPADRRPRPSLARSGMTAARLARAYRKEARATTLPGWIGALDADQREWFREHGRRLVEALVSHLDSEDEAVAQASLEQATAQAAAYGRVAAGLGVSLSQAVEGFLRFRLPFVHQLRLVAHRRGFDSSATGELMEDAERLMDRLLVAAMNAHNVERVAARPAPGEISEGIR
jgi:DNA-binding transcriptional MerR regulator